jgi:hypothetical protein
MTEKVENCAQIFWKTLVGDCSRHDKNCGKLDTNILSTEWQKNYFNTLSSDRKNTCVFSLFVQHEENKRPDIPFRVFKIQGTFWTNIRSSYYSRLKLTSRVAKKQENKRTGKRNNKIIMPNHLGFSGEVLFLRFAQTGAFARQYLRQRRGQLHFCSNSG